MGYGCIAEVITNQGSTFRGFFEEVLRDNAIDHNFSRPYHPQANGLVEMALRTIKAAITKLVDDEKTKNDARDLELPSILRGNNWSRQSSTGYSPFFLLHGYHPKLAKRSTSPLLADGEDQGILRRPGRVHPPSS